MAVATEKGTYFLKGKSRFKFFSDRVFQSWRLDAVEADYSAIKHITFAGNLGFRDGTLINNVANGRIYLVSGNRKRHIVDPDVFEKYGLDMTKAILVSDEEANIQKDGEVLK